MSPKEAQASLAEYGAWAEEAGKRGALQGGERLRPTTEATTAVTGTTHSKTTTVPAPGLVVGLAAVAVALTLVRRRLA